MTTYIGVAMVTWPLEILGNEWWYLENNARQRHHYTHTTILQWKNNMKSCIAYWIAWIPVTLS